MCGRYEFSDEKEIEEIKKILNDINQKYSNSATALKTGEIFPTNNVPILSLVENKPSLSIMTWGFPKWDSKGVIINAKSETASEKKMFAKPLMEKRCVILSTGFYEWNQKGDSKKKDKYLFTAENSPMLYMAGFYNQIKIGEQYKDCFVILTRDANPYISDIHDRMPVILYKDELKSWLNDINFMPVAFNRDNVKIERQIV